MTQQPSDTRESWDGVYTHTKREKTLAREVGAVLLAASALISTRYWWFLDVEMIKAFGPAYTGLMTILIPTGVAPFIATRIMKGKGR